MVVKSNNLLPVSSIECIFFAFFRIKTSFISRYQTDCKESSVKTGFWSDYVKSMTTDDLTKKPKLEPTEVEAGVSKFRKFCHVCPYRQGRTNNLCQKCQKFTCRKHFVKVCVDCGL